MHPKTSNRGTAEREHSSCFLSVLPSSASNLQDQLFILSILLIVNKIKLINYLMGFSYQSTEDKFCRESSVSVLSSKLKCAAASEACAGPRVNAFLYERTWQRIQFYWLLFILLSALLLHFYYLREFCPCKQLAWFGMLCRPEPQLIGSVTAKKERKGFASLI